MAREDREEEEGEEYREIKIPKLYLSDRKVEIMHQYSIERHDNYHRSKRWLA
jgi:hypothetical protein